MARASLDVGKYTVFLSNQLGNGAFGVVYKARDEGGQPVAAKKISVAEHRELAVQEVENFYKLMPLQHDNIVKIFDINRERDVMWIFMEQCELGDLDKYFRNNLSRLSDNKKVDLMLQIAEGVEFLHTNGITHRDIKPANILVNKAGHKDPDIIKLTDFGLTKFLDPDGATGMMSTATGTPLFMAPEFWDKSRDGRISYTNSVDIYAAGLTYLSMLQAISGRQLFPYIENTEDKASADVLGLTIGQAMLAKQKRNEPEIRLTEITDADSRIIMAVKKLIKQMTYVKPDYRATASQCRAQLETISTPRPESQALGQGSRRIHQVELKLEKHGSRKFPLAEFPTIHRVYDILFKGDQTWLLGEEDSIHQAKLCFYDKKENITKTFPVGNIPCGVIQSPKYDKTVICTEENGLLIIDMRPDKNMKTYTFMYNMKPNFCTSPNHAYILKKLEEGFTITSLKINIGPNNINLNHDFSLPLEMSRPYALEYIFDKDVPIVPSNSLIVIGSHHGVNKVMAVHKSGVSWQINLDHFPISIHWHNWEDGVKKYIYLILTTESLVAILGSGEVVKTNYTQLSEQISKMVGLLKTKNGVRIIHASGTEYTVYKIK